MKKHKGWLWSARLGEPGSVQRNERGRADRARWRAGPAPRSLELVYAPGF